MSLININNGCDIDGNWDDNNNKINEYIINKNKISFFKKKSFTFLIFPPTSFMK
jgi:hypothetical protein